MTITREDVIYTAKLARLALTPAEIDRYCDELSRITEYMAKLREAVADAGPCAPVLPLHKVADTLRDDEIQPHPSSQSAVSQAPDRRGPYFRVPAVIR
jgi:aspartyl-tRNA(Asn)/glutamyl-tRNA(Gln) amidotransferase subunit C